MRILASWFERGLEASSPAAQALRAAKARRIHLNGILIDGHERE